MLPWKFDISPKMQQLQQDHLSLTTPEADFPTNAEDIEDDIFVVLSNPGSREGTSSSNLSASVGFQKNR